MSLKRYGSVLDLPLSPPTHYFILDSDIPRNVLACLDDPGMSAALDVIAKRLPDLITLKTQGEHLRSLLELKDLLSLATFQAATTSATTDKEGQG